MRNSIWGLLLLTLVAPTVSADTAEGLDQWFSDGYAALYAENAWDRADEFGQYFADVIAYRSDDGLVESDVNGFVVDSLDDWRSEGWRSTHVDTLHTQLLNETTAVFDIKWRNRNADDSTDYECGWYVADKIDGKWLLSQYIAKNCAE